MSTQNGFEKWILPQLDGNVSDSSDGKKSRRSSKKARQEARRKGKSAFSEPVVVDVEESSNSDTNQPSAPGPSVPKTAGKKVFKNILQRI